MCKSRPCRGRIFFESRSPVGCGHTRHCLVHSGVRVLGASCTRSFARHIFVLCRKTFLIAGKFSPSITFLLRASVMSVHCTSHHCLNYSLPLCWTPHFAKVVSVPIVHTTTNLAVRNNCLHWEGSGKRTEQSNLTRRGRMQLSPRQAAQEGEAGVSHPAFSKMADAVSPSHPGTGSEYTSAHTFCVAGTRNVGTLTCCCALWKSLAAAMKSSVLPPVHDLQGSFLSET